MKYYFELKKAQDILNKLIAQLPNPYTYSLGTDCVRLVKINEDIFPKRLLMVDRAINTDLPSCVLAFHLKLTASPWIDRQEKMITMARYYAPFDSFSLKKEWHLKYWEFEK